MAINLGTVPMVTFVIDMNTPEQLKQYAGVRLLIGPGLAVPSVGTFDTLVINGVNVPGFLREGSGGNFEWVMQPGADPIMQALNSIPAGDGWKSEAAKALYQNIGAALLAKGISLGEALQVLKQAYQGAVSNFVAAHPQDSGN